MNRKLGLCLFLILVPLLGSAAIAQTLDEVLAKHAAAHGGVEKWRAVNSLIVTGTQAAFSNPAPFLLRMAASGFGPLRAVDAGAEDHGGPRRHGHEMDPSPPRRPAGGGGARGAGGARPPVRRDREPSRGCGGQGEQGGASRQGGDRRPAGLEAQGDPQGRSARRRGISIPTVISSWRASTGRSTCRMRRTVGRTTRISARSRAW